MDYVEKVDRLCNKFWDDEKKGNEFNYFAMFFRTISQMIKYLSDIIFKEEDDQLESLDLHYFKKFENKTQDEINELKVYFKENLENNQKIINDLKNEILEIKKTR